VRQQKTKPTERIEGNDSRKKLATKAARKRTPAFGKSLK